MQINMLIKDDREVSMEPSVLNIYRNILSCPNHLSQVQGSNCFVGHCISTIGAYNKNKEFPKSINNRYR